MAASNVNDDGILQWIRTLLAVVATISGTPGAGKGRSVIAGDSSIAVGATIVSPSCKPIVRLARFAASVVGQTVAPVLTDTMQGTIYALIPRSTESTKASAEAVITEN
jgi:hypothetical protein